MLIEKYKNNLEKSYLKEDLIKKLDKDEVLLNLKFVKNNSQYIFNDLKIIAKKSLNIYKLQLVIRKKYWISKNESLYLFSNKKLLNLNHKLENISQINFIEIEFSFVNSYGLK